MRCLCALLAAFVALPAAGSTPRAQAVFRLVPRAEGTNRMVNAGFEAGAQQWQKWGEGFARAVGPDAHSGRAYARLTSQDAAIEYGVFQSVVLNQAEPRLVIAEAWSRADNVSGVADHGYSLYIDVEYRDGSHLWQQAAAFPTGTHGWVRREVVIKPAKPIKLLLVYGLLRKHTGTACFDDFAVYVPQNGNIFDGTPVAPSPAAATPAPTGNTAVRTADALALELDPTGRVARVGSDPATTDPDLVGLSGFFLRDVAAQSAFVRPAAKVSSAEDGVSVRSSCDGMGLRLDAFLRGVGDRIVVSGSVSDTTGGDRCVTVYFALPVALGRATWWDDVVTRATVEPGAQYGNWANVGVGTNGFASRYPWSAVSTPAEGLSLCVPIAKPQVMRMGISAGLTYIAFDLGLSQKATKMPGKADFEFGLYRHDPAWGFRSAAQRYYDMFPEAFTKRVPSEGIWLITRSVKAIKDPEDFHFKFHETGWRNDPVGAKLGILSFRYSEPWRWRQRYKGKGTSEQRTRQGTLAALDKALQSDKAGTRRHSWAVKSAVCHDESGKPIFYIEDAPWGTSALFVCNADPRVPRIGPDNINQAFCFYSPEIAKTRYESGSDPKQDGEYIDSVEGFRWPRVQNYRAEHFAHMDQPLTFGTQSRRVCILTAFSHWAFLRYVGDDLHRRGKLMFGNALPTTFYYFAPYFDVMGTEHQWIRKADGSWRPETEARTHYRRALCYRKPYLMLLNTDFTKMEVAAVEKYMRRCAFFGMFPSMFSHDAYHDRYFDSPKYYDRDRHLFKKYVPIILDMARAGWCPITHARCPDTAIRIERFGNGPVALLSLMNADTRSERRPRITFDREALGLPDRPLRATELFSGRTLDCSQGAFTLQLAPDDVAVVRLH